jgi:hypothetical protein
MSSIYFDDGKIGTLDDDPPDQLLDWLKYRASIGEIVASAAPPPEAAFTVTAAQTGPYGNGIEVTTVPAAAPTKKGSVDVTVSATDHYKKVAAGQLKVLLGMAADDGTQPGLMLVSDAPSNPSKPNLGIVPKDQGAEEWTLAGAGATAVKLAPRSPGADFDKGDVLVRIEDAEGPGLFTLIVTWSRTVKDVVPSDFAAKLPAEFAFLVTVDPEGGAYRTPRAGTFTLSGWSDPIDATKAKATVPADD